MKKFLKTSVLFVSLLAMAGFASCKDDKDDNDNAENTDNYLEESFISIENAQYNPNNFPDATINETLTNVDMSDQVMNGAVNFVTVTSKFEVSKFFVGIDGVKGYLEYKPQNATNTSSREYVIPVMIAQNFTGRADLLLSAQYKDGAVTVPAHFPLYQLDTRPGALEIKLAFSNEKDVDIHLFTPSGIHICYWTSGDGYYFGEDHIAYPFGLDIDSNAGCEIDGINKENIYIPEEYVENGVYTVAVDLYENCDPRIPTSWSVTARYNGKLITPLSGKNPASDVFPVGAQSSYEERLMQVMTFEITNAHRSRMKLDSSKKNTRQKIDLNFTEAQKRKMRMK